MGGEVRGTAVVHAEKLPLGMKHELQAAHAATIARRFNASVIVDSTGGATGGRGAQDSYIQFYRLHMPALHEFYWHRATKQRIIEHLTLEIEQRKLGVPPNFRGVFDELAAY